MFVNKINNVGRADPVELENARNLINAAKRKIDSVQSARWHRESSWMELSRPLAVSLRGHYGIPVDASNAFFKCIELFNLIGPFLREHTALRHFDNASLPGDFIRASQWWTANKGIALDWRANSLIGGLDDRFGLFRENPTRWMMSATLSGDVTSPENCEAIREKLTEWPVDLYTSDLGFAVASYFHEEEEHFAAHQAQCELGMSLLRPGGALIVKTFTMTTAATRQLISRMVNSFSEFYIVKPATSKLDNSECYWVALDFVAARPATECPHDVARAQHALAQMQAKKIVRNIEMFHAGECPDFTTAIKQWCERHIDNYAKG